MKAKSLTPKRTVLHTSLPYPFAVQSVVMLALLAAPLSALGLDLAPWRLAMLTGLCGVNLLAVTLAPVRRFPGWGRVIFLVGQVAVTALAHALAPAPLLDYVYLTLVLQAIVLLPLWQWIGFAVGVYTVWSGMLLAATRNVVDWVQGNLTVAFPALCAIIAVIFYLHQQRQSEQVQQMFQQMQQRYEALTAGWREVQQRIMLEERQRLTQMILAEVQSALSRTEQSVTAALMQAQSNLSRLQAAVRQTRDAAASAVERLRGTVARLREVEEAPRIAPPLPISTPTSAEPAVANHLSAALIWILPGVFLSLTIVAALLQPGLTPQTFMLLLLWAVLLLVAYVITQRVDHLLAVQVGLAAQTVGVLALTLLAHTLTPLLGLLLVLWQLAVRLPLRHMAIHLVGLLGGIVLLRLQWGPQQFDHNALLMGLVAGVAVGGPLLLARRQMERRRQVELRLALLNAEIEQQLAEVRMLAAAAERSRLAREVHDDLGSRLVLIHVQLQLAEDLAAEDSEAAIAQLRESREQLRLAWRSVLAVADAELPVRGAALRQALEELATATVSPPRVTLHIDGDLDEVSDAVACAVYRTVQEGLTNARKHSRATWIRAHVTALGGYVTVTVTNDDVAEETSTEGCPAQSGGFGLVGLRERAEALNGGMEAGPLPGGGWRLRVVLPVDGGCETLQPAPDRA